MELQVSRPGAYAVGNRRGISKLIRFSPGLNVDVEVRDRCTPSRSDLSDLMPIQT